MNYETLKPFSKSFLENILKEFPEWEKYVQIKNEENNKDEQYILIEMLWPSQNERVFFISTQGEEITIGVDEYHTHICYGDDNINIKEAIEFINGVICEKIIIVMGYKNDKYSFGRNRKPDEFDIENIKYDYDVIYLLSWTGTYNRVINIA